MVTGDHPVTAAAVARNAGILSLASASAASIATLTNNGGSGSGGSRTGSGDSDAPAVMTGPYFRTKYQAAIEAVTRRFQDLVVQREGRSSFSHRESAPNITLDGVPHYFRSVPENRVHLFNENLSSCNRPVARPLLKTSVSFLRRSTSSATSRACACSRGHRRPTSSPSYMC